MSVTDIRTESSRSRARIVVLDAGELERRTSAATLKLLQLEVGSTVDSPEAFESDVATAELATCTERAYQLLGYRDRSIEEMRQSLAADGYLGATLNAVVDRLTELGYLDDVAYASRYIRSGLGAKKGLRRITRELQLKGVHQETIECALSDESMEETGQTEADNARLLTCRWLPDNPSRQEVDKVLRRLVSRGYSFEVARGALDVRFLDDSQ